MSTKGAVGIRLNGIDKVGFNHFDSYPAGLGADVLVWLNNKNIGDLKKFFDKIEFTNDDIEAWDDYHHCLNIAFQDNHTFLYDSLFCEYAYIVNLDDEVLEFYVGFNKDPNAKGRYAKETIDIDKKYYGVKLFQTVPLNDLFKNKYKADNHDGFSFRND